MNRSLLLVSVVLLIHLVLLINTRFTLWPEMVVYPYLLNNGFVLYRDIINPYPPLLTSFLALFAKIFGYRPMPYQILTWVVIFAADLSIFLIVKKIFKKSSYALASLLFFVILSIPFGINGLWFDLIQLPFILFAFYYFYKGFKDKKLVFDSLFFAFFVLTIAFFIKQQVIWLIILFLTVAAIKTDKKTVFLLKKPLLLGPFLILSVSYLILFGQKGIANDFLSWTIYFPFVSAAKMPGYVLLPTPRQIIVLLALVTLFIPLFFKRSPETNLILATATALLLFAYPRFDYFHLVPLLAILSIAFGQTIVIFKKSPLVFRLGFFLSLAVLVSFLTRYLLTSWHQQIRFFENEIIDSANFLAKITQSSDSIYIQNGPDQIFPLAKRLPPKPWVDEFPWYLEKRDLEQRVIEGIKSQNPRFVVFKPYDVGAKYALGVYRPQKLADYLDQNYQNLLQISDTLMLKVRK